MIAVILIVITLIYLAAACYTDLKTREVPDWLSYSLIFAALVTRSIASISLGWEVLISGILGLGIYFGLACLFYYTHQWGGGDSKLLMGMGVVIGVSLPFDLNSFNLLWFFLALLFLGAIYGLFWMTGIAIKNLLIIVFTVISPPVWPMIFVPPFIFYLLVSINLIEETFFLKKMEIGRVTEGDWLAGNLAVNGKLVLPKKTLTQTDLLKLQQLKKESKLRLILIKEGIPFIPSFLLAYLFLELGGVDLIWRVVGG